MPPSGSCTGTRSPGSAAWASPTSPRVVVPDTSTLYRIASITKTFTGTAIMQLRDEGLLHLDDPAVAHLPELASVTSPFGAIETVTIRRMLSHESGLQGDPPGTDWLVPEYEGSAERNLARVGEVATTINTQQKYSNLAYQLLGEIVSRRSRMPYPEYVRARILEPLGMDGSGFEPLPAALLDRRAMGTPPGSSPMSWSSPRSLPRYGPKGVCGRASTTLPGGCPSSSGRTGERGMARRSWRATH